VLRLELIVFAVAVLARLALTVRSGGLAGNYGYDASVYYAAADGLIHGKVPYANFVLLHPPMVMLALTPFAWLGTQVGDHGGFIAANIAAMVLGAANAVLVVRVAGRMGLSRRAAAAGGLFYALWLGAVWAEYLARLEPVGNCCLLLALLALLRARSQPRGVTTWYLLGGAALGAACMVKIWWSAPVVVLVAWFAWSERARAGTRAALRRAATMGGGIVMGVMVIAGPFLALAPHAMLQMVVSDQLGRTSARDPLRRLGALGSFGLVFGHGSGRVATGAFTAGVAVLFALALLAAARIPPARLGVLLAGVQLVVLFASPSFFGFYADFAAVGLALVVAGATEWAAVHAGRSARLLGIGPVACTVALALGALIALPDRPITPYPGARFAAATRHVRCVMADSPMALIELDALSRSFAPGCRDAVDVTGMTYSGPDKPGLSRSGRPESRRNDAHWQRTLRTYLFHGQAFTIIRARGTGIGVGLRRQIGHRPELAHGDGYVVYASPRR
jgi:hypothetical protein